MNKSDVQYWIKRYDIKYQQNKENYDKLKECEQQLATYKDKIENVKINCEINYDKNKPIYNHILAILNEGDK